METTDQTATLKRYLKIQNKGLLNTEFFYLMGVSTKANDDTKIGEHGTGLKYAIAYFLRAGIDIRLFVGRKEIKLEVKNYPMAGMDDIPMIYVGGKRTPISTSYGKQWEMWQAIREIYCNALDEGVVELDFNAEWVGGVPDTTTFYIDEEAIKDVIAKWSHYFTDNEPLFENDLFAILPQSVDKMLRIYKQGILIMESDYKESLFNYDFKDAKLNELREYGGTPSYASANAIFNSSPAIIEAFLKYYNKPSDGSSWKQHERNLNWNSVDIKEESLDMWRKYVYLFPGSTASEAAENHYRVPNDLFSIMEKAGMSVEEVALGFRSYGGGSAGSMRIISNPVLEQRIKRIINNTDFIFKLGVATNGMPFDFQLESKDGAEYYVFDARLATADDEELEVICDIAVETFKKVDIYKQLKEVKAAYRAASSYMDNSPS